MIFKKTAAVYNFRTENFMHTLLRLISEVLYIETGSEFNVTHNKMLSIF
jgi:hypothetical protein